MGVLSKSWWACIFVLALLLLAPVTSAAAEITFYFSHTTYSDTNDQTTYSYVLEVSDNSILEVDVSELTLSGMDGVLSQGDALMWRNAGYDDTSATWVFANDTQPWRTKYAYFDVVADSSLTEPGIIDYAVDAQEGRVGTVEGPVAISPRVVYPVSGTVYLDNDRSGGLYDPGSDEVLDGVAVTLLDSSGNTVATTTSNLGITDDGEQYIGNYRFGTVPPGEYTVVVAETATGPAGEVLPTTATEQAVTVVDAPVREVDFGYAPEQLFTISGTTFIDYNRDGVWDQPDEEPLSDVGVLQLVDDGGNVVAETFSAASPITGESGEYLGNYIFTDVPAGSYTVVAPETAGELGTLEITGVSEKPADVADAVVTGVDFGYLDPGYTQPAIVDVQGYVFFDFNRNGQMDDFELAFEGVGVTLSGDADQTEITDADGLAAFGEHSNGDYTMAVTDGGVYGLLQYWETTTAASYDFTIDADTESPVVRYFGYYPDVCKIIDGIRNCEITGDNHTIGFWKHNVVRAILRWSHGVQVTREDLLGYLSDVEDLGPYDDPFDLGDSPLRRALWYLHPAFSGNRPLQKLDRQLLAGELNWVSDFNSSMPEMERAILWYAEWVRNHDQDEAGAVASLLDVWNNLGNADCDGRDGHDGCDDPCDDENDADDDDDRRDRRRYRDHDDRRERRERHRWRDDDRRRHRRR
ncbi:MAG: MSCRAMM family protein [Armatimonadota bacterium]